MNKKHFSLLFAFIMGMSIFISSCKKEETPLSITINVESEEAIPDYTKFVVEAQELRTLKSTKTTLNEDGSCQMELYEGTYKITVEWKNGNALAFGTKENYSVTQNETLTIPITVTMAKPQGLIFKEIFFNGETNNGRMMHPDQYFVLYNNGDEPVYADGVTFAVTAHANWSEEDMFTELLPNEIVVSQLYSIPGNGLEYPVAPGEQIVVASTAIDHSATYENAVDLSGADFEIYDTDLPERFPADVDNPDVPNMIGHFSYFGFFVMHPRGPIAPLIFKPETDMKTFMENHKFEFVNSKGETRYLYKVPADLVLDGIETGNEAFVKVKSLPPSVDKGYVTVTGCHRQELIRRKMDGNKLMDTNDSSVDCERVKGASSFPKKTKSAFIGSNPDAYQRMKMENKIFDYEGINFNILN